MEIEIHGSYARLESGAADNTGQDCSFNTIPPLFWSLLKMTHLGLEDQTWPFSLHRQWRLDCDRNVSSNFCLCIFS